jgi:hypothetical protein
MRAQVTVTVDEAKALIARAIARMPRVARAAQEGLVVLHPSSSAWHVAQCLTGEAVSPPGVVWGMVVPKGPCIPREAAKPYPATASRFYPAGPGAFPHSWAVQRGQLTTGTPLGELLDSMGPRDVYIKGANAIDSKGHVGVLIGSKIEGGTIGMVLQRSKKQGFGVIYPCGLEKLIPGRISRVVRQTTRVRESCLYSMGMQVVLKECRGTAVTEVDAIQMLAGAQATPIASGGLGGAEGAKTLLLRGSEASVREAVAVVRDVKGIRSPQPAVLECRSAGTDFCVRCSLLER